MNARRATLEISYNGTEISGEHLQFKSATWNDKSASEADDFTVTLEDTQKLWRGAWFPSKGANLDVTLKVADWDTPGASQNLPLGRFQIDEIELSSPSDVIIKAVSTPITSKIRGQAKTKAWENIKLSAIAGDIASGAGLSLMMDVLDDPLYQREDQLEESDLSFLQGLCTDSGYSLKVANGKLVIFSQAVYDSKPESVTITPEDLKSFRLSTKSLAVHSACTVQYHDPETDEDLEYTTEGEMGNLGGSDENSRTLMINRRCKSLGEAQKLAENTLMESGKYEVSGYISMPGCVRIVTGINIALRGFGKFDGRYAVDSTTHTAGSGGYETGAEIRSCGSGKSVKKGKKKGKEPDVGFQDFSSYGDDFFKEALK